MKARIGSKVREVNLLEALTAETYSRERSILCWQKKR